MKPDLTPAIKFCFFGVDNKNEGVLHLKSFTLKFAFTNKSRTIEFHSQEIFPSGVFCYPLQKRLLYIVGNVTDTGGASLHTHVTACRRASLNSFTEATRKRSGELGSSYLLDVLGLKKIICGPF